MSDDCGCCTTPAALVPAAIENRPGLSAVAYRIGTFATFRKAIVDQLAHTPELAGLTSRVGDDYTITAVELWAAVADVLTFYQERAVNEAFLRTATLRDSMLRLVRLLGYELRPGIAATTRLAFTLEAGATALIPAGTRVQSVPGEGEKPQKFETLIPVMADARLNKLRIVPAPTAASPKPTGAESASAIVAPDAEALASAAALAPGDRVMLYAPDATEVLTVREVQARDDVLTIRWALPIKGMQFDDASGAQTSTTRAYKLGRSFQLFGFNAPPTVVVLQGTALAAASTDYTLHGDGTTGNQISLDARYEGIKPGAILLVVSGTVAIPFEIKAVAQRHVDRKAMPPTGAAVIAQSGMVTQVTLTALDRALTALPDDIRDVVVYELVGAPLRFWPYSYAGTLAASDVFIAGRRSGWSSIEVGRTIEKGVAKPGTPLDAGDLAPGRAVLLTDARGGEPIAATIAGVSLVGSGVSFAATDTDTVTIGKLGLESGQATPVTVIVSRSLGATIAFPNPRRELTVTIGALPTQRISLSAAIVGGGTNVDIANVAAALQAAIRAALPGAPAFARAIVWVIDDGVIPDGAADGVIAIASGIPGDRIALGSSTGDAETVVALGLDAAHVRFLDGVLTAPVTLPPGSSVDGQVRLTIDPDRPVDLAFNAVVSPAGELAAAFASGFGLHAVVTTDSRVLVLPPLPKYEPRAFLHLALDLDAPFALDAATAVLLGNVAPASHGETVRNEIVGDGDASQPFQRFTLKKKPVTRVPAAAPGGVASSLQLLVNGVRWTERASLYGASPQDQIYVTRIADDGALTVQFGDGVNGARPPSGRQNLVAWYRQGLGLAGRVKAGTLSTLLDRPTGVKSAINLIDADGGVDPETLDRAREAAPGTVRTFGRAISLRDFEDTALLAGEVAKVSATWVWTGERRAIHLTLAAQDGATFSADGLQRIAATLATERDPNHRLLLDNYTPVAVTVDASILVDDRYVASQVLATARAALLAALSFTVRRFAQPVYLSDVFRVLQDVVGVVAVDVNRLDLKSRDAAFRAAHGVDDTLSQPLPRLRMLPARPAGVPGTVLAAELAWVEAPAQDVTLRASGGLSL
jgi:hypothetical protein